MILELIALAYVTYLMLMFMLMSLCKPALNRFSRLIVASSVTKSVTDTENYCVILKQCKHGFYLCQIGLEDYFKLAE